MNQAHATGSRLLRLPHPWKHARADFHHVRPPRGLLRRSRWWWRWWQARIACCCRSLVCRARGTFLRHALFDSGKRCCRVELDGTLPTALRCIHPAEGGKGAAHTAMRLSALAVHLQCRHRCPQSLLMVTMRVARVASSAVTFGTRGSRNCSGRCRRLGDCLLGSLDGRVLQAVNTLKRLVVPESLQILPRIRGPRDGLCVVHL
mmetsp:Transcript_34798/g.91441  ORF Transcript_34798/g.91441 Transcript_34798/m.91441 type:complete len:204 (-) Transcript_34798:23-634(-)